MWKSRYKSGTNEIRLNTHEREEAVLRVLHRLSPHDQERIHEHFFNGVPSLTTEQIHTLKALFHAEYSRIQTKTPVRFSLQILRQVMNHALAIISPKDHDPIMGDLEEEYQTVVRPSYGRKLGQCWYCWQLVRIIRAYLWQAFRRFIGVERRKLIGR